MHKFIQEHLKRGTIQVSKSHYAANFFFVKKKDRKLRLAQDYWPINKWIKKNRNVSPLIPQVIDHLSRCTKFTIIDIHWGYNNIWIKEGDEGKAAFLTHEGLFEPMVMFFRLTNSPATFQMMMNTIFWKEDGFTDLHKVTKATASLQNLKMRVRDLDGYASQFKSLANKAGYNLDAPSTI